jgi:hypothetical protein
MQVRPLHDRVLVKRFSEEEKSKGHPRSQGPQRRPRQKIRLPDRHQGRRDRRQGNRAGRSLRKHGRPDGQGSRQQDQRHRRRRHHHRHRLAEAIYAKASSNVTAGANPMEIKRGIDKAVEAAIDEELAKISKKVKDKKEIAQVATVSANWTGRSARSSPTPWTRSARTASSPSKKPRASRPPSTSSKACSSTRATSPRTSSPTRDDGVRPRRRLHPDLREEDQPT